jgi:hypothetical protein
MKYLLKYSCLLICLSLLFALGSCVKDRNDLATDFSTIQPIVELRDNISGVGNDAGIANFGKASLNFTSDPYIQSFYVNLASVNVRNSELKVTLGVDQAALDAYNADPNNGIKYEMMPDSLYDFTVTEVTIPSGLRVAKDSVIFYSSKFDPSKSYMLPISVIDASGVTISGNFGTIYYHIIGNPLAGTYNWSFYRYNDVDTIGVPNGGGFEDFPTPIPPTGPTTLAFQDSYQQSFFGGNILMSFTNTNGVFSDFSLAFDDAAIQGLADGGFTLVTAPTLVGYEIKGDASNHYAGSTFRIYYEVINSTPAHRKLIDNFVKQ